MKTEEEIQELADKYADQYRDYGNHKHGFIAGYKAAMEEYAEQSRQAAVMQPLPNDDEPYFGWCDVKGCKSEGCNGGNAWRDTGYWTVCSKHSSEYREGKPQPKMKQEAINREMSRLPDGTLPF